MNKFLKVLLIIGGIALVGGGVIVAVNGVSSLTENLVTNEYTIEDNFESFNIDVAYANVEIKKATDGVNKVVCEEREKQPHKVNVEENKLKITNNDAREWYEKLSFWDFKMPKVTVYLKDTNYTDLKIESSAGSLNVNSGFTFSTINFDASAGSCYIESNVTNSIYVESSAGSIFIKNSSAKSVTTNANSGSVNLENVTIQENFLAEVNTGSISLRNTRAKNFDIKCDTGSVSLKDSITTENIKVRCATGSVNLDKVDAATLDIKTSTGSVSGTLLTSKIFSAKSSTGRINVPVSTTGGLCQIETSTGSINVSIVNA